MKLTRMTVKNFKCIDHSNEFSLNPITCLVGKNEAGKTALLQALYKLKPVVSEEQRFELTEYPRRNWREYLLRHDDHPDNVLTTVWELEEHDKQHLTELLGSGAIESDEITVKKGYGNTRTWDVAINEQAVVANLLDIDTSGLFQEELDALAEAETVEELIEHLTTISELSDRQ